MTPSSGLREGTGGSDSHGGSHLNQQHGAPWMRWLAITGLVLAAAFFSFLNSNERVTLDVGVTTLYQISLVGLVFGSFLAGMIAMFLFGLRHDRRVRGALRDRAIRQADSDRHPSSAPPTPPSSSPPDIPP